MGPLPTLFTRSIGWAASVFYEIQRIGGPVPEGPVLVTANHLNAIVDPIVLFHVAGRPTRPLAKAPLFGHPVVGPILRALGGLPVYRRQDDPTQMDRNEETFRGVIDALKGGQAVQIYPEGQSHSGPSLTPLRTGAARIALRAEAEVDWTLGLHLVPIGLTYSRKAFFRGRAAAMIGEPFRVVGYREEYEQDPVEAARKLTAELTSRLEAVTLNLSRSEDLLLIETAERLYAREKGLATWRERDGLGDRLLRLKAFAHGLAWLRANDPERHRALERAVSRYRRLTARIGAGEADVPPRYPRVGVVTWTLRQALVLGIGAPFAFAGMVAWYPPYLLTRIVSDRARVDEDAVATYKLGSAIFAFPLFWLLWILVLAWIGGIPVAAAGAALLPLLGLIAVAWRERWQQVKEDARLFLRVLRHPRIPERLAAERAELVRAFDRIAVEMPDATDPAVAG